MEEITNTEQNYKLTFRGEGGKYFGIVVVNWLLTVITLGIYYPWAKERQLKYLYGTTHLNESPFKFHGTGKEMFIGFIKAIVIFGVIYGLFVLFMYLEMIVVGAIILYAGILAIIPLAIHGSYRYRMSRTSWRGIRFGYRGDKSTLYKKFFKWLALTIVTLGIYGAWMQMHMRNYVLGNVRMGNMKFKYKGDGFDFFILNLVGYLLSIITLGIYSFWWQKDLFAYYVDNLSIEHEGAQIRMKSDATGGDFFGLIVINVLILIFTLGLGYAWVVTRTADFVCEHIKLKGDINLDELAQTEENFTDAMGEDMGDMLDIDFIF